MILSWVASMVFWQLAYTYNERDYNGTLTNVELARQVINGCWFICNLSFNLAHWVFAFNYLALSYRLKLASEGLPEDKYNRQLNTVNAVVCLINVAASAVDWAI